MKEQTATKHDGLAWQRHRTVKSNEPEPEDTDITAFCINLTHNSDQSHRSNLWLWLWRQKLMDKSVIKNICKGRRSRLYQQQSRPYWQQIPPRQAVKFKLLPKPATKSIVYSDSRLCCRFVAGFGNSRLCRQCVPNLKQLTGLGWLVDWCLTALSAQKGHAIGE